MNGTMTKERRNAIRKRLRDSGTIPYNDVFELLDTLDDIDRDSKVIRNTRVLLHALGGGLRSHIEQSVATAEDLEALEAAVLINNGFRDPDVQVDSIIESKTRTEILLVNAERLYDAWRFSSGSGAHRLRCRIIFERYYRKQKFSDIAQKLNRTEKTILSQLGIALDELSVYFFGEGGLQ